MKKNNIVFLAAVAIVFIISACGLFFPEEFASAAGAVFSALTGNFDWLYTLSMALFVGFSVWIGFFSKYKNMRLGADDSKPEYSTASWFAMLFSAGMGIGLVFWSVAEPMSFFAEPLGAEPGTPEALRFAMTKAFLHWGIHPWANYTVIALAIAYMQYRRGKSAMISSLMIPLYGDRGARGPLGKVIDIFALLATVGGVCTTLGLGVMQINSGMNYLFGLEITPQVVIITVVVLTVIYVSTAVAGVEKGSAIVSNANVIIAGAVMVLMFIIGPTGDILNNLIEGIGEYFTDFISNSFAMGAFGGEDWYSSWTIYYWAWWIAWSPFTGSFIARISKGRTVKEFVTGVLFLPAIASMIWFAIFGTLGTDLGLGAAREAITSTATALFYVLDHYPLGRIFCYVMLILVCTFFCASATSATITLGTYSEGGTLNPSNRSKVIWGLLLAMLSLSLMLSSDNGIDMLKTISIVVGFPFAIIKLVSMAAFGKALREENPEAIEAAYRASGPQAR